MTSKSSRFAVIMLGLIGWYAIVIATDFLLVRVAGITGGGRYALLGGAEIILGGGIVLLALRVARLRPLELGWTAHRIGSDALVGLAVALGFAAVQFLVIIPATGGAGRSDIVANAAQIGETPAGLAGVLTLALLGSTSEEFLFRGLLLGGLTAIAGAGRIPRILSTAFVIVVFALSHGYQGWAGVIDTGLYGGLLLSLLYWWRGRRLIAPIVAHAGWNMFAAIAIYAFY